MFVSDDDPLDLSLYVRTLEQFYYEFLIYFADLIKPGYEPIPLQAVIFGSRAEFQALCQKLGFPKKANLLGFYQQEKRILFLYNIKGEEMTRMYLYPTRL